MNQAQQSSSMAPELLQLAEVHHLGSLRSVYNYRGTKTYPLAIAIVVTVFMGVTLIVIPILWVPVSLYILGLVVMGAILYALLKGQERRHLHNVFALYTEGFLVWHGRVATVMRWEQISQLWRGTERSSEEGVRSIGDIDLIRLRTRDEIEFKLSTSLSTTARATICDSIESAFLALQMPAAIDYWNTGKSISFGTLSVSKQSVSNGEETLLWSQIERFDVGTESVVVRKEGRTSDWFRKLLPSVPNACLLRELLTYTGTRRR